MCRKKGGFDGEMFRYLADGLKSGGQVAESAAGAWQGEPRWRLSRVMEIRDLATNGRLFNT